MERILVTAIDAVLDEAGLTNEAVRAYVKHWAQHTGAERVEVVNASDDARLIQESLEAGELLPAGEGRYYSRSHPKDTARSSAGGRRNGRHQCSLGNVSECRTTSEGESSCSRATSPI